MKYIVEQLEKYNLDALLDVYNNLESELKQIQNDIKNVRIAITKRLNKVLG